MSEPAPPPAPERVPAVPGPAQNALACVVIGVLALLLAVWGAFLTPFRVGGTTVPVSWAIAAVGNVVLGLTAARVADRAGTATAGLAWALPAFALGSRRAEGDLVILGGTTGLGFLLIGTICSAAVIGLAPRRPRVGADPAGQDPVPARPRGPGSRSSSPERQGYTRRGKRPNLQG